MTAQNRVTLRLMEESDINEDYVSWFNDAVVTEFLDSRGFSIDDAKQYLRHGRETRSYFMHAIIDRETGLHIGNMKLGPISWVHSYSDLVTVIGRREFWGKGYATEAITQGIEIAFKTYGFRKLSAGIVEGNEGSLKAYTRAGFIVEGRLKGQYLIEGQQRDRIKIGCFNPKFFPQSPDGN